MLAWPRTSPWNSFQKAPNKAAKVTGTIPTAAFVEAWAEAFASSPPNATLIAHPSVGDDVDVAVVVTLTDPVYDEAAGSLTYQAEILEADRIAGRVFEDAPVTAIDGPQEFAEAHLFIDDIDWCEFCIAGTILSFGILAAQCSQLDNYGC